MAQWNPQYNAPTTINGGNRFESGDGLSVPEDFNKNVENNLYAVQQAMQAYKITQPIDNALADNVGIASLEIDPTTGGLKAINLKGETGVGVKDTLINYQVHTDGTNIPTEAWLDSIPSIPAEQFLWTRIIFVFTDNTTQIAYSVSMAGATGATPNISAAVEVLPIGEAPTAEITGTPEDPLITFGIPFVAQGTPGVNATGGSDLASVIVPVNSVDWQENTDSSNTLFKLIVTQSQHSLPPSSGLLAFAKPFIIGNTTQMTYDSPIVENDTGNITLYSNSKWEGIVIVASGITEIMDSVARQMATDAETNANAHTNLKLTDYLTESEINQLIQEQLQTLLVDKGSVAERQDLPTTADNFDSYLIEDEDVIVFAYNKSDGLAWLPLNFFVDMSLYETVAGSTEKMNAAVVSANAHTDTIATTKANVSGHTANQNVVTNSNGEITTEAKPIIPNIVSTSAVLKGDGNGNASAVTATNTQLVKGDGSGVTNNFYSPDNPPPTTANPPFRQAVTWGGSVGAYTYTLSATIHGKGIYPLITTLVNGTVVDCEPFVDASGNITIYSNANTANTFLEVR